METVEEVGLLTVSILRLQIPYTSKRLPLCRVTKAAVFL